MGFDKFKVNGGTIFRGDCLEVMKVMPENSIDSIVCDPPYALTAGKSSKSGFMNQAWDRGIPPVEVWKEALRVTKPGGFLLAFGGSRTHHRLMVNIEDAGWSIKDCFCWVYSSGFPKSLDISKSIDKLLGVEREVVGKKRHPTLKDSSRDLRQETNQFHAGNPLKDEWDITLPSSSEAKSYKGYGTALKPAFEIIIMAQKPVEKTYASNCIKYGVGGLNIDATRIGGKRWPSNFLMSHSPDCKRLGEKKIKGSGTSKSFHKGYEGESSTGFVRGVSHPGNQHADPDGTETITEYSCSDDCPINLLNEQAGIRPGCKSPSKAKPQSKFRPDQGNYMPQGPIYGDTGYASRFFLNLDGEKNDWDCSEECPIRLLDEQSGDVSYGKKEGGYTYSEKEYQVEGFVKSCKPKAPSNYGDSGGASRFFLNVDGEESPTRFFYCAKASRKERGEGNTHPTVKPLKLLEYLVKLITPPKQSILLDPFCGSGTTLLACKNLGVSFIGIELESEYVEICKTRLSSD